MIGSPVTLVSESWVDVVERGERLSPQQYQAFQLAIAQVKQHLQQVLCNPMSQRQGQFELDGFVDSLHEDFLAVDAATGSRAGQTAFLITRLLADNLLELQRLQKRSV
ncbi:DNA-binding protein [Klebsiella indica]|uniref:DNA-binding protein n=1 Tax=Klebsiella indica TaxID=2582917 RepID=A0A5R9LEM1_9ENTR|nr:DNA-binding protein [Klebsiella indica]TLV11627.1 DNA-binding protein [Klebsiella indica]